MMQHRPAIDDVEVSVRPRKLVKILDGRADRKGVVMVGDSASVLYGDGRDVHRVDVPTARIPRFHHLDARSARGDQDAFPGE